MNAFGLFEFVLFLFGSIYALLGYFAYDHVDRERGHKWALSPFWALNSQSYNDFGKRLCSVGKPIFYFAWGGFLVWLLIKAVQH